MQIIDTTIVIGYQPFAKRLLESKVIFQLANAQFRTDSSLSRRPKSQKSMIDWQHTRRVLMDSYGRAEGFSPTDESHGGRRAKKNNSDGRSEELQSGDLGDAEETDGWLGRGRYAWN